MKVHESTGKSGKARDAAVRTSADGALGKPERALLTALAQNPDGCTPDQLGILSGYSPSSSHFGNKLGALRTAGFVNRGQPIQITESGIAALGSYTPLPKGEALRSYWLSRLKQADRALLNALIDAYPRALSKNQLGEKSGYSPSSSHFGNTLGKLRTLRLVTGYGECRAADALFDKPSPRSQ